MPIKKIHFLIPPTPPEADGKSPDRIFGCNYAFFFQHNIFILYPATLLKKAGYDVRVIDCAIENETIASALKDKADAYVFYSVFLSRGIDLQTASIIESSLSRDTPIIFMGSDPTYCPEKYLLRPKNGGSTISPNRFVIRGEPEYSLLDLINNLECHCEGQSPEAISKVEGVSWVSSFGLRISGFEKVIHNPYRKYIEDLDSLPFPDRTLLKNPQKYFNAKFKKLPSTTILTSRGCAFKCYYCVPNSLSFARELEWKRAHKNFHSELRTPNSELQKPPVAKRSVGNIIEEFREVARPQNGHSGYRSVFILDDQFVWGRARTLEILDGIKDLNLEISLLARPDMLTDKELVNKMAEAGVRHVDLGVESFNEDILRDIRKDLDVTTIEKSITLLKEANIKPEINIMLGASPLETEETIKDTLEKVKRYDVDIVHAKICAPFPGTEFHDIAKKSGWMITKEYVPIDTACDSLISYPHLSREKLIGLLKTFYHEHYFNPRYLIKHLTALKSFKELKNKARTAVNIWKNIIRSSS
ncbi:MAG TPA: radical SAM protein [Candidatus Brocadiales bacterium]|nr:radical SAM protein [Candidatus Brocadiales bacterium]